jgi:hypothetical protein
VAEGRQEVEDCRSNRLVDEEKHKADINLLSLELEVFGSWTLSLVFFEVLSEVFRSFRRYFLEVSYLVGPCTVEFFRRPLVPRSSLFQVMALPGVTKSSPVSVFGTTIGNHTKVLRNAGSFCFL